MTSVLENRVFGMSQLQDSGLAGYRPNTKEQPVPKVFKDCLQHTLLPPSASWSASSLCFLQETIAGLWSAENSSCLGKESDPHGSCPTSYTKKRALLKGNTLTKAITKGTSETFKSIAGLYDLWVVLLFIYFFILLYFEQSTHSIENLINICSKLKYFSLKQLVHHLSWGAGAKSEN